MDLGTLRDHKEIRMFDRPSRRDPETRVVDWTCDAEDVPICLIPDLAIRIFHWDCRHGPLGHPDSEDPDSELAGCCCLNRFVMAQPAFESTTSSA